MFTGIIEEVGHVEALRRGFSSAEIAVCAHAVLEGTHIGDSIAVNGVCLTVTSLGRDAFLADAMPETLRRSTLGTLSPGFPVNLERALLPTTRLGGHIVSGHIDGMGRIASIAREDNAHLVKVAASPGILRHVVEKGSVALDGVSLTVAALSETGFTVSLIPHTFANTAFRDKRRGDAVNVECDIVGKYVERLLSFGEEERFEGRGKRPASAASGLSQTGRPSDGISLDFLTENGF